MAAMTIGAMKKQLIPFAALLLCSAAPVPPNPDALWTPAQIHQLLAWLETAPKEGLTIPPDPEFAFALRDDEPALVYPKATEVALRLARAHLMGCSDAQQRAGWSIANNDDHIDLPALLTAALASNDLDGFFKSLRPRHPEYDVLRRALLVETDSSLRTTLIRNLERWRWMPLDMGRRYLLVNAPGFEVGLWENGRKVETWRVIVGKRKTPTPVFSAVVTGVTMNPWWDVPQSIVAESVGRLARTRPAEARRRGYVWAGGSYRQRPGPKNALGAMKLVMPNPYNVYLHDTPNKALFDEPVRAFSHGCIRVGNALGLAGRLLGHPAEPMVAQGATVTLPVAEPLPVYITYFTADMSDVGTVEYHSDIYGRDSKMGDSRNPVLDCPA
jgi:murein L,D-transpeptidase YcbB/YkuD